MGAEIVQRRKEVFRDRYLSTLQPTPGARELVQHIKEAGIQVVIATSADKDELEMLLEAAGIEDLVEEKANASDAEGSKPDPDIVQAALDKSGSRPEESLMIGDSPFDIESAGEAGVATIALRCGGRDSGLEGAIAVFDDPADLLAHWNESPLAQPEHADR